MLFIFIFGLILILLLCSKDRVILQFCILVCALFIANRGLGSPDTLPYLEWYHNPPKDSNNVEQGYVVLCYIFKNLGFSFNQFLFILAFFEMQSWLWCTEKLLLKANYNKLLGLCLAFYGIYFWGCVIRASIAITIAYYALTLLLTKKLDYKCFIIFYALVAFAMTFHKTAIIYSVCPFLISRWNKFIPCLVYGGSLVTSRFMSSSGIIEAINVIIASNQEFNRFQSYLDKDGDGSLYSFSWLISFVISTWITIKYATIARYNIGNKIFFFNIYLLGFLLLTLTSNIPAGSRLGMMYTFFEFIVIYYLSLSIKSPSIRFYFYLSYCLIRFSYLIHSYPLFLNY